MTFFDNNHALIIYAPNKKCIPKLRSEKCIFQLKKVSPTVFTSYHVQSMLAHGTTSKVYCTFSGPGYKAKGSLGMRLTTCHKYHRRKAFMFLAMLIGRRCTVSNIHAWPWLRENGSVLTIFSCHKHMQIAIYGYDFCTASACVFLTDCHIWI